MAEKTVTLAITKKDRHIRGQDVNADEQRIIHEAASDAARALIASAEAIGSLAETVEDERQATLALYALGQMYASQESMHRLFVELNKEQKTVGGNRCDLN